MMKSILVVEDELDISSSLEIILSMENYEVHLAFHGKEALALLKGGLTPDLILSDMMMPVMEGYTFVRVLNESPEYRDIPLILMSAAELDQTRLAAGSWDLFVRKPFNLDKILREIAALLGHP
jgi:two-component system phosphate regulon response regulator PhoB